VYQFRDMSRSRSARVEVQKLEAKLKEFKAGRLLKARLQGSCRLGQGWKELQASLQASEMT
jgi:hypothetical protein